MNIKREQIAKMLFWSISVSIALYSAYLIYKGWGRPEVDLTWPVISIFFHGLVMPVILFDTSEVAAAATICGILYWLVAMVAGALCLVHNLPFTKVPLTYLTGIWAIGALMLFLFSLKK